MIQVLELNDVTFAYNQQYPVLRDVNFHVHAGEFQAVVGPNGGGKTTLLKLIMGLLSPQRGTVQVLGTSPARARSQIGYMPQQPRLDPDFPALVSDLVKMGCLGTRRRGIQRDNAVQQVLEWVGLSGMETKKVSMLSGGQLKRALIARALVAEPRMLILDEPTANLDPKVEQEFFDLLSQLNQKGITILVVSHDLSFVSPYVRRVVCVNQHVVVHPVGEMAPEVISHLYGQPMRPILHHLTDNCC